LLFCLFVFHRKTVFVCITALDEHVMSILDLE
jgi:hypothetical protein